jgi:hypothetical protein
MPASARTSRRTLGKRAKMVIATCVSPTLTSGATMAQDLPSADEGGRRVVPLRMM